MRSAAQSFFTKDKEFYKAFFRMLIIVALQNVVAYSVNVVDNVMLGGYSQNALSGAATVNQVFFMVDQFALSIGNTLVALAAQYWGEKRVDPIRTLTGISLKLGLIISVCIIFLCGVFPEFVLSIFTNSPEIIAEGRMYMSIVMWTFALFIVSNLLLCALRAVGTVKIAFIISVISLGINVMGNYVLIYGKCGFPEMGVRGAATSTLIARIVELIVVVVFLIKFDKKLRLFKRGLFAFNRVLKKDYTKMYLPMMVSQVFWGVSVPMQTAILGHLSANAIAANSVSTTLYQYLKVVALAMSATSGVMIGHSIGRGDRERVKSDARSMALMVFLIGIVLGLALLALINPMLSLYTLNDETMRLARQILILLCFVMVSMSYQMPVSFGIIQGAGNPGFTVKMNMISTWCIVMPLSFMAAFWWQLPVILVVLVIQSDQFFKAVPVFFYFRRYTWIRKLTRDNI